MGLVGVAVEFAAFGVRTTNGDFGRIVVAAFPFAGVLVSDAKDFTERKREAHIKKTAKV